MGFSLEKLFRLDLQKEAHNMHSAVSAAVYRLSLDATHCQRLEKRQETLLNILFSFQKTSQ